MGLAFLVLAAAGLAGVLLAASMDILAVLGGLIRLVVVDVALSLVGQMTVKPVATMLSGAVMVEVEQAEVALEAMAGLAVSLVVGEEAQGQEGLRRSAGVEETAKSGYGCIR